MAPSFVLNVTRLWSFEPQDLAAIRVTQAVAQDVECPARQGGEDGRLLATRRQQARSIKNGGGYGGYSTLDTCHLPPYRERPIEFLNLKY